MILSKMLEFVRNKINIARFGSYFQEIAANDIVGLDLSHYQGYNINWQKMKDAGVKFVILKCSEGTTWKDDTFAQNYKDAKSMGMKVAPYHFVTAQGADAQYNWFVRCMGDRVFDILPAMDAEVAGASQSIVNRIGTLLENYMASHTSQFLMPYYHPCLYTNVSLANTRFNNASMNRFPLWLATRNTTVPTVPKNWKTKGLYVWQDSVTGGARYGIKGNVDHNYWGTQFPFPGDEPPIVVTKVFTITVETEAGKYSSKVKLEKK